MQYPDVGNVPCSFKLYGSRFILNNYMRPVKKNDASESVPETEGYDLVQLHVTNSITFASGLLTFKLNRFERRFKGVSAGFPLAVQRLV